MSAETLTTLLSAVGLLLSLGAGFGWMIRRIDAVEVRLGGRIDIVETKLTERIDAVEAKLTHRIDTVEAKLTERIDTVEMKLSERIDALGHEVVEVKIAVARLEGPQPRLITGR